jgi:Serine/threonine protein kinase
VLQEDLTLPIGASLQNRNGDRYIIDDLLGQGGFSAVYLVHERRARHKIYALKEVINPENQGRKHLSFEAEVLRRLNHHSLPHVYQIFEDSKLNRLYMLMDYIEGKNLELLRSEQPNDRFSLALAMTLLTPIVDALTYLHNQQPPIIHRDLKPSNIIIPYSARDAVLVDFGLAKEYIEDKTTNIFRFGTPGYAAPEQYGQGTNTRTDIYAVGATLYTLLTGKIPTDALSRTFTNTASDPCLPAHEVYSAIAPQVSAVIAKAMHLRNSERYTTIEEFWQALSIAIVQPTTSTSTKRTALHVQSLASLALSKKDQEILATAHTPAVRVEQSGTKAAENTIINKKSTPENVSKSDISTAQLQDSRRRHHYRQPQQQNRRAAYQRRDRLYRYRKQLFLIAALIILTAVAGNIALFNLFIQKPSLAENTANITNTAVGTQCGNSFAPANSITAGYPHLAECYTGTISSLQDRTSTALNNYTLIITWQDANTVTAQFRTSKQQLALTGKITPEAGAGTGTASAATNNGTLSQSSIFMLTLRGNMNTSRLDISAQVNDNGDISAPHFEVYDQKQNEITNAGNFSAEIYTAP